MYENFASVQMTILKLQNSFRVENTVCKQSSFAGGYCHISWSDLGLIRMGHSIPNQQKKSSPSQISLKIGTHVGSIGKPHQTKI